MLSIAREIVCAPLRTGRTIPTFGLASAPRVTIAFPPPLWLAGRHQVLSGKGNRPKICLQLEQGLQEGRENTSITYLCLGQSRSLSHLLHCSGGDQGGTSVEC